MTTHTQNDLKRAAGEAALKFVRNGDVIGVGTGSTVDHFIEALAAKGVQLAGAVASSDRTAQRLTAHGVPCVDLNDVDDLSVYIDGADEIDNSFAMIKGGGGALTREKIVAGAARRFICIADESKKVEVLGRFPLPIEVIALARAQVMRILVKRGGDPQLRIGFTTDNGHEIIDVRGLSITDPFALESALDHIPGVVSNGLFARRPADILLLATKNAVVETHRA